MQSTEKLCNGKRQTTRAHIPTYTCVLQPEEEGESPFPTSKALQVPPFGFASRFVLPLSANYLCHMGE